MGKRIGLLSILGILLLSVATSAMTPMYASAYNGDSPDAIDNQLKKAAAVWVGLHYIVKNRNVQSSYGRDETQEMGYLNYKDDVGCNAPIGMLVASDPVGNGYILYDTRNCVGSYGIRASVAYNATVLGPLGLNPTSFLEYMGYKQDGSGNWSGGNIADDQKINDLLKKHPEIWPPALGEPDLGGGVPNWITFVDRLEGVTKIGGGNKCFAATSLKIQPDGGGNVWLEDNDTVRAYRVTASNNSTSYGWSGEGDFTSRCNQIIESSSNSGPGLSNQAFATDYVRVRGALKNDPNTPQKCSDKYAGAPTEITACEDGLKNKTDPTFCDKTYPAATKAAENAACVYGQKYSVDPAAGSTNGSKPTCVIKSIGWLVCPIMNFMATVNDGAQNYISMALVVNKEVTDQNGGTFTAWQQFRNYANAAFVLAFLIIIFSQISSIGITNYGIKKMLPKLIVAAILVNVSYYVCQLAVDISNMLGYSLSSLLSVTVTDPGAAAAASSSNKWLDTIGGILGMTGLGVAAIALLLSVSTPVVLAALLALALTVLILIGRQALIILLIVISPLAFVAYLLPNTENWFKKWYKLFSTLLLLFPIVALVFGASKLASTILSAAANGIPDDATGGTATKTALGVGALGVSAIPLLIVLPLLKNALAAAGSVGAMLSKASSKANSRIGKKWNDTSMLGAMSQQRQRNQQLKRAQTLGGHGNGLGAKYYKGINRLTGKNYGGKLSAHGAGIAVEMEKKEVADEAIRLQKQKDWTEQNKLAMAQEAYEDAVAKGDTTRARAAQSILIAGGAQGIDRLHRGVRNAEGRAGFDKNSTTVQKCMSDLSAAGLKGKDAALNAWSYSEGSIADIESTGRTYSELTDAELAGQSLESLTQASYAVGADGQPALTAERARAMMGNDNVWQNLSGSKQDLLRTVAGTAAGPATPTGANTSGGGGAPGGVGATPNLPPPGGAGGGPTTAGAAVGTPGVLNIPHASLGAKVAPANPAPVAPSSAASSATSSSGGSSNYSDIGDLVKVGADGKARHVAGQQSVTKDGSVGKVGGRFLSDYESEQIRAHADQIRDGLADRNTPGSGGAP